LAVSVGAGPALAASADAAVAADLSAVLTLGGYASARELLRFTLTGGIAGGRPPDEAAIAAFLAANADLVDDAGRRLAANRDPAAVDALLAGLPPPTQRLLDALSPERWVRDGRAPLFLVHGHDDPAVPVTESARLAAAAERAGREARLVVVGAVGHVEPGAGARLGDLARLAGCFYAFTVTSARSAP
ncbi:MAG TPA: prolyl oligopeptidase family serine peptidase, partial [Methylomirabilota bacterium]|nr:prolyl oligopeptidase family serine peptidase [Methylomirabilota bacterium]